MLALVFEKSVLMEIVLVLLEVAEEELALLESGPLRLPPPAMLQGG